jgi:two-component system, OmpR family, sensor histidine kinase VicK
METRKYPLRAIKDIGRLSSDGILVYDLSENQVNYCNNALGKILGMPKTEIINSDVLRKALLDDDALRNDKLYELKSTLKISNVELRVRSNEQKYISLDAYYISKANVIVALVKDISKAKQHSNYIIDFGAKKDAILDMVAHNLSGPLNVTYNLLDAVDRLSKDQQSKKVDNYTHLIRENTQQCIDVINSLLREEHLVSENIHVESNRFDVISKLKIVVDRLKEFAEEKEVKIVAREKELFVTADDVKFFQVVHNLISNAFKFTGRNGKISVEVINLQETFQIKVTDDGIGIPEYLHPHLFKKNTPAGRLGLKGEKSIGMGLYIVKKLVKLMRGTVDFESAENEGTVFIIEIPKN